MANKKKPTGKPVSNAKKTTGSSKGSSGSSKGSAAVRNAKRSTVVSKKQRPWGIIAAAVAVVLFAAGVVTYAVVTVNNKNAEAAANDPQKIEGVQTFDYDAASGSHSTEDVDYPETPPVGGTHNPTWADCSGTVYTVQIKNEYAVHGLEHGAVWITYDPSIPAADLETLKGLVEGTDFTMLSPYPDQGSPISLQSWGHQLKVDSAGDARIKKFLDGFRVNEKYTPEFGATCSNPEFKTTPLTPADGGAAPSGAPSDAPVSGAASDSAAAGTTPST